MGTMEKKAISPEERSMIIKSMIIAGGGAALIGALARSMKKKKPEKIEKNKNAIIVPISQSNFLSDLPTPDEFAQMKGESDGTKVASAAEKPERKAKFDFFKKASSSKKPEDSEPEKKNDKKDDPPKDPVGGSDAPNPVTAEKNDDGRIILRGQDGRFVSPTDPIAVEKVEKVAEGNLSGWDVVLKPIDSAKSLIGSATDAVGSAAKTVLDAAVDRPVWYTAGALGSIIIAAKISDYINKNRVRQTERSLNRARKKYIELLNEKSAGVLDTTGTVLGASFIIPFALAAIIKNRMIEKEKKEAKKRKEMTNSYPEDPVILYKTIDDKEVGIPPKVAMAAIMVKRAMILSSEMEKIAQDAGSATGTTPNPNPAAPSGTGNVTTGSQKPTSVGFWRNFANTINGSVNHLLGSGDGGNVTFNLPKAAPGAMDYAGWLDAYKNSGYQAYSAEDATNYLTTKLTDKDNSGHLLNFAQSYTGGGMKDPMKMLDPMMGLMNQYGKKDEATLRFFGAMNDPKTRQQVMSNMSRSQKLNDELVNNMKNNPKWEDYVNNLVENGANGVQGLNATFKPGSILHALVSWFMRTFGIGKDKVIQGMNDMFAKARREYENGISASSNSIGGGGTNVQAPSAQPIKETELLPRQNHINQDFGTIYSPTNSVYATPGNVSP